MEKKSETNKKLNIRVPKHYDTYKAILMVEEEFGKKHTVLDQIEAWASLIKSGDCWRLNGWFRRFAAKIIECGIISQDGTVDYGVLEEEGL